MGSHKGDRRGRPSLILDAGYVSITSVNKSQTPEPLGLSGRKLHLVICTLVGLYLISFINLTCLLWLMQKFDWSFSGNSGPQVFRLNKYTQQVEFGKEASFNDTFYTSKLNSTDDIDVVQSKQLDIHGNQNSIVFDNGQISLTTDKFHLQKYSFVDFTNFQLLKFHKLNRTRVRLNNINSEHIHSKSLNLTATDHMEISNMNYAFFYGQKLVLEANRNNRRSILRFSEHSSNRKSIHDQRFFRDNLRLKSDLIFFDLPRLPLLSNTHRSESGTYRICICNTTFFLLRSFAHQPCPLC